MDDLRLGRAIRLLRHRRGWRQVDLAARAGVGQSSISDMERGWSERYTLATIRDVLGALDARAQVDVAWGARGDLDRLFDADHARIVGDWARRHLEAGWELWPEASYSIYGERGRIDHLAFHRPTGTIEVAEIKTGIWNLQETIGNLDVKVRLAPRVAAERGWHARRVVSALVLLDHRTVRRRVEQHATLLTAFDVRGREVWAFVRDPRRPGRGVLAFVKLPDTNQGRLMRAGRRRVRVPRGQVSVGVRAPAAAGSKIRA